MHVKDILDGFDIRVKLPQHWYSTDVSNDFEDAKLLENDEIIKIETEGEKNTKLILIDVNDGMSVVTKFDDGKVILFDKVVIPVFGMIALGKPASEIDALLITVPDFHCFCFLS